MDVFNDPLFNWLPVLGFVTLFLGWATAFVCESPRPARLLSRSLNVTAVLFVVSLVCLARVITVGDWSISLGSALWLPLGLRFDLLSVAMLALISLIGSVCVRFSLSYLDGDPRQGDFLARMMLTILAVSVLVVAGTLLTFWLAWVAVSVSLAHLLLFYGHRPRARSAARKKVWVSRIGEACLGAAFLMIIAATGTSDIAELGMLAASGTLDGTPMIPTALFLLAAAALLRSAQVPTHAWLTEVMEAPTPVSALLHAGIVNAGGFLVLRFADLFVTVPDALVLVAVVGGITALFGSLVMLFQTSIKVTLAWSTIAQMGLMMLQCGLGAFPAAALHIAAHSFYKAHAFLSSGSVIDSARTLRLAGVPRAVPANRRGVLIVASAGLFGAALAALGQNPFQPGMLFGLIAVIGLVQFVLDETGRPLGFVLAARLMVTTLGGAALYLVLHGATAELFADLLPVAPAPALQPLYVASFAALFTALAVLRGFLTDPVFAGRMQTVRIALANGLYLGLLTDRWIGRYQAPKKG